MKPAGYSSTAPSKLRSESTGQGWTLIGAYKKTLQTFKLQLASAESTGNEWACKLLRESIASVAEQINALEKRAAANEKPEKLPIGATWTRAEYGKEDERI